MRLHCQKRIRNNCEKSIVNFDNTNLNNFDSIFRHSNLVKDIDA